MFTDTLSSEHIVVKNLLGGAHPHDQMRDVEFSCEIKRIVLLPPKLSRIAKTIGNQSGLAKELQCGRTSDNDTSNHVLTRTEIHKHTKNKTLSCKRFLTTWRCGHHIATTLVLNELGGSLFACSTAAIPNAQGRQR